MRSPVPQVFLSNLFKSGSEVSLSPLTGKKKEFKEVRDKHGGLSFKLGPKVKLRPFCSCQAKKLFWKGSLIFLDFFKKIPRSFLCKTPLEILPGPQNTAHTCLTRLKKEVAKLHNTRYFHIQDFRIRSQWLQLLLTIQLFTHTREIPGRAFAGWITKALMCLHQ